MCINHASHPIASMCTDHDSGDDFATQLIRTLIGEVIMSDSHRYFQFWAKASPSFNNALRLLVAIEVT